MHIPEICVDLCKATFKLVVPGDRSKVLLRKKCSCAQLLAYTANLPSSQVGLEACWDALSWEQITRTGHVPRDSCRRLCASSGDAAYRRSERPTSFSRSMKYTRP
jgi:hypothetical protein